MLKSIKKSTPYIMLASLLAFARLMMFSFYVNVFNKNTREVTDRRSHEWSQSLFNIMNATLSVQGKMPEIKPGKCYIIISNHLSLYDIPAVYLAIPQCSIRMIGKKELFRIPFFGASMKRHEFICIDRQNRNKAIQSLEEAKAKMRSGIVIWAAAEGTRSRTGELLPFKKGLFLLAIQAQATIIPLMIQGTERMLPAKTWKFRTGEHVTIKIGPSIDTAGMSTEDRDPLTDKVRGMMQAMKAHALDKIDFSPWIGQNNAQKD